MVLRAGEVDITTLAAHEKLQPSYITRVVRLAFLSPQITAAALNGGLRAGIDAAALTTNRIPVCWRAQAAVLLPDKFSPL